MEAIVVMALIALVVGLLFVAVGRSLKEAVLRQTGWALISFALVAAIILLV